MSTFVRLAAVSLLASFAQAQTVINLSDYLPVPAGQASCNSNPPVMESIDCAAYGIGHDCPGNFSAAAIRFSDLPPFIHGLGMHPPNGGMKTIRFDLDAIRTAFGREPMFFQSRVGIDVPSGGNNGANFITALDGAVVNTTNIPNVAGASVSLNIPVAGARYLLLSTQASGIFAGNHACWGDAKLILGPECPTPAIRNQPRSRTTCPHTDIVFSAEGTYWGPFTYQWLKNGTPITLAQNPTARSASLEIPNASTDDTGEYACILTNSCGNTTSNTAMLGVCSSDFNCDSTVDFFDYLDFVGAFSTNDPSADFNADTVIDFFDYLDFVAAFSTGC